MKNDRTRKRWPFNLDDCSIEITAWAGLTVFYITLVLLLQGQPFCIGKSGFIWEVASFNTGHFTISMPL
jgi:hypothetical protein